MNKAIKLMDIDDSPEGRELWLAERKNGIGGSEIGALVGLSSYASPYTIYWDKKGVSEEFGSLAAELGLYLEEFVVNKVELKMRAEQDDNIRIRQLKELYQHPTVSFARYSPDGEIAWEGRGLGLYEGKTASAYLNDQWKDGNVPPSYLAQIQWGMGIMGYTWGVFGYLIGNQSINYQLVEFDQEFFDILLEEATNFWNNHILTDTPPEPSGIEEETGIIRMVYPYTEGSTISIEEDELSEACYRREEVKAQIKELEKECDTLDAKIRIAIKGNETTYCGGYKIVDRQNTRQYFDKESLMAKHPAIYMEFNKVNPSTYYRITKTKK